MSDKYTFGYKGRTFMDTGFFYAPYVPLLPTPSSPGGWGPFDSAPRRLPPTVELALTANLDESALVALADTFIEYRAIDFDYMQGLVGTDIAKELLLRILKSEHKDRESRLVCAHISKAIDKAEEAQA